MGSVERFKARSVDSLLVLSSGNGLFSCIFFRTMQVVAECEARKLSKFAWYSSPGVYLHPYALRVQGKKQLHR